MWQNCPSEPSLPGYLDQANRENETMNHLVMRYVLCKLGFVKDYTEEMCSSRNKVRDIAMIEANQIQKQEHKFLCLWKILGGEFYGHVTLNNLRMILLAIKGLHVQPDIKKNKNMEFVNLQEVEKVQNEKMRVQQ